MTVFSLERLLFYLKSLVTYRKNQSVGTGTSEQIFKAMARMLNDPLFWKKTPVHWVNCVRISYVCQFV